MEEMPIGWRLDQWQNAFDKLYGRRNRAFIPSRSKLIAYLALAIGNLKKGCRKEWPKANLEKAIASVFGWTMAIANSFKDLPLDAAMHFKWGGEKCLYCDHVPCSCVENRPPVERKFSRDDCVVGAHLWTVTQYQRTLRAKYFGRNKALGAGYALERLFEELVEVIALDAEVAIDNPTVLEIEDEYALELADVLGWLISICNLLEIDLEPLPSKFYGRWCSLCGRQPCLCGKLIEDQGRFHRAKPFTTPKGV